MECFGRPTFDCPWRHQYRKWGDVVCSLRQISKDVCRQMSWELWVQERSYTLLIYIYYLHCNGKILVENCQIFPLKGPSWYSRGTLKHTSSCMWEQTVLTSASSQIRLPFTCFESEVWQDIFTLQTRPALLLLPLWTGCSVTGWRDKRTPHKCVRCDEDGAA